MALRLALFRIPLDASKETPEGHTCDCYRFEWWIFVSDAVVLQYMGFESKGTVREYAFRLRGTDDASSEYFVTIANEAFVAHRVRYQDAPDICSLRIRREFATQTDHPPSTRFSVTDAELADYQAAHTPKTKPSASAQREDNAF